MDVHAFYVNPLQATVHYLMQLSALDNNTDSRKTDGQKAKLLAGD
ncbi:hypothetical protein CIHG_04145 [Coccidioides immitis H538.4]|uniref:Uncharacterized protein n=3 Tax=Coccidioides immitis TaxID=5501 RepID=A0A0J8TWT9_COCIT|nr:hypothetical protein CIRG_04539 [Coccidioides immitis RMSCC 2394]KMU78422.1 hypothetical protein CISG_07139 [Coccidioides immitis RMSCC 3703]KMU86356.1 hypothetical protein CIHG_04145 [Coccidioides immitis H538.4]